MYKDNSSKVFFEMLNSIDDLSTCGTSRPTDEVRAGDLTFIDTQDLEGDGFIYVVKVKGAAKSIYQRIYRTDSAITLCCPTDGDITSTHPLEDVTIRGKVTGIYRKLPALPMVDLQEHTHMMELIKAVDTGNYCMRVGEMNAIRTRNMGGAFGCICDAFRWGFLKGQRAEKARAKKQRQQAAKRQEVQQNG